jgi:hypothetical protein
MVTEKETAVAKEYLEGKTIKGIWVNSNGELFSNEHLAKSSDEDAEFVKNTKEEKALDTDTQAENLKLLEETELTKENYKTLVVLVNAFKIEVSDKKAETLIAALTQFKETLKTT